MDPKGSLPHSQETAACPYPELKVLAHVRGFLSEHFVTCYVFAVRSC